MITLTTTLSKAGGTIVARMTSGLLARLTGVGSGGGPPAGLVLPWAVRVGEASPSTASSIPVTLGDF